LQVSFQVRIFQAKDKPAAVFSGEKPVEKRRPGSPDVQAARRAGREANAYRVHFRTPLLFFPDSIILPAFLIVKVIGAINAGRQKTVHASFRFPVTLETGGRGGYYYITVEAFIKPEIKPERLPGGLKVRLRSAAESSCGCILKRFKKLAV
jgi:hypothetical protein